MARELRERNFMKIVSLAPEVHLMPARIKTDDTVVVISGKDRGKRGKVLRVDPKKERVFVEGLNIIKRHQRPQQTASGQTAGWRHRARGSDPRVQRDADRPQG